MKNTVIFIALCILFNHATAASFDCQKAATSNERAICDNPALSGLDSELSTVYKDALAAAGDNTSIRDSQRAWLKEIKSCESKPDQIVECLTSAYSGRISSLKHSVNSSIQPAVVPASTEPKQNEPDAVKPPESPASAAIQTPSAESSALPSALNQPPKALDAVTNPTIFEDLAVNKVLANFAAAMLTLLLIFLPRLFGPRAPKSKKE
jgi:uncharacterized protein